MENLSSHLQKFPIALIKYHDSQGQGFPTRNLERGQVQRDLSGSVGERRLREAVGHVAGWNGFVGQGMVVLQLGGFSLSMGIVGALTYRPGLGSTALSYDGLRLRLLFR